MGHNGRLPRGREPRRLTGCRWCLVVLLVASIFKPALADSVQYSYDTLGRLVEAVDSTSSEAIEYSYDAIGNITSIQTVSTGVLSVAGYSTDQAAPGTQITIYGTGFSTAPAGNTVTFNGMQGTVVSSTSTQLVVTVPSGATAGPILVATTTGGSTIGAPMSGFSPASADSAPTITSFSPTVGAAGTAVTVRGANFQSLASDWVQFNQYQAQATSASNSSITTSVPAHTSSGRIQVTTPYGSVASTADFIIPPLGYSASSIGASGRLVADGSTTTVTLSTANKIAIELFDGVAGQYLTLGLSNNSVASVTITVIDPDGNTVVSATASSSTPAIQLPELPDTGTYSIVIDPGANTGSLAVSVAPPLTGSLIIGGVTLPLSISPAGRRALVTFNGTAGQYVTLSISAVTLSGGTLTIINPNGTTLISGSTNAGALRPLLPATGTYTVFLNPAGAVGGNITLGLALTPAPTLHLNAASYDTLTISDSNPHTLIFNATPGQIFTLAMCWCSAQVVPASLQVLEPDGSVLATATPTEFTSLQLGPVPESGTYAVVVQIPGNSSSIPLNLALTTPVTSAISVNTSTPITTSFDAQGVRLTFSGNAGEQLSFGTQETCSGFDDNNSIIKLLKADGTVLQTGLFVPTSGCSPSGFSGAGLLHLAPLPSTGTYTLEFDAGDFFDRGSLTFQLYEWNVSNWASGALTVNGSAQNETLTQPQPGAELTFNASAGQSLTLTIQESAAVTNPNIQVFAPDGTDATASTLGGETGRSCSSPCSLIQTAPLSPQQTGTYTLLLTPTNTSYGSGTFTVQLTSP